MKAIEQYFSLVLPIMLYMVLTFESVDEILLNKSFYCFSVMTHCLGRKSVRVQSVSIP